MKTLNLCLSIFTALLELNCSIEESTTENTVAGFQVNAGDLQGSISSGSVSLNASETYILTGALIVKEGAVLTIPAGTTITAAAGTSTSAYIGVERGAKIYINGTAAAQ